MGQAMRARGERSPHLNQSYDATEFVGDSRDIRRDDPVAAIQSHVQSVGTSRNRQRDFPYAGRSAHERDREPLGEISHDLESLRRGCTNAYHARCARGVCSRDPQNDAVGRRNGLGRRIQPPVAPGKA